MLWIVPPPPCPAGHELVQGWYASGWKPCLCLHDRGHHTWTCTIHGIRQTLPPCIADGPAFTLGWPEEPIAGDVVDSATTTVRELAGRLIPLVGDAAVRTWMPTWLACVVLPERWAAPWTSTRLTPRQAHLTTARVMRAHGTLTRRLGPARRVQLRPLCDGHLQGDPRNGWYTSVMEGTATVWRTYRRDLGDALVVMDRLSARHRHRATDAWDILVQAGAALWSDCPFGDR